MKIKFIGKKITLSIFATLILSGCSMTNLSYVTPPKSNKIDTAVSNIPTKNKISQLIKSGIKKIQQNEYNEANKIFSQGLRLNPANGHLHFLNAFSYHMLSLSGNTKMINLAQIGYITALKFDDTNYWAAYLLGHIYFNKKEYLNAQNQFSYGLLFAPKNPYLLRSLAVSSYYSDDIALNSWAAKKAYEIDPNNLASLRNLLFSQAASGEIQNAKKSLKKFDILTKANINDDNNYMRALSFDRVSKRVNDWNDYYQVAKLNIFGNSSSDDSNDDSNDDADTYDSSEDDTKIVSSNTKDKFKLPKMSLVDVVIIQTEEIKSQSKGVNLLEGLKTTLSGDVYNRNRTYGTGVSRNDIKTSTITLSLGGLEYNLNIFNDGGNKAEILAGPSLLATEGKTSKFYSGSTLHVQLNSANADGSMEDIDIGIKLNVTPKFYDDNIVKITVHAEKSLLQSLAEEVGFSAYSQVAKTTVDATAVLKFGETLVLSGLTESSNSTSKSGVPFLQSTPLIQYLFSNSVSEQTKKSVIILLTPRKAKYANEKVSFGKFAELKNKKQTIHTLKLKEKENIKTTNIDATMAHLSNSTLYTQFRSGDLKLDDWNNADTFEGSIKRIAGFLYY